jgi:prophage regulatory protein
MLVFQRLPQVLGQRARSRASHYNDIAKGLWTKPVSLGPRCAGWPQHETEQLQAARLRGATDNEIRELVETLHRQRQTRPA